mmetsp:Transcript_22693/g.34311  ORF Transcript_22693/g.34311 Transcript_22693/m.34311 type:complete len:449 (-) Transcript_22693:67-1413(-)
MMSMSTEEKEEASNSDSTKVDTPKRLRWNNRDIQEEKEQTINDEPDDSVSKRWHRRQNSNTDIPHDFEEHTYSRPTTCDVCDGLLVGLWSQGLQCKICRMNVHRGEGSGEHDDCRAEALLMSCPGYPNASREVSSPNLGKAIHEIRQLAIENSDFVETLKDQMDKDIKALAKGVIVEVEVENQRSKHLRRLKDRVEPFIKALDNVQARGELHIFVMLSALQAVVFLMMLPISVITCVVALSPKHGILTDTAVRLSVVHNATVAAALYGLFFLLSLVLRYYACLFKRKSSIVDRFLQDVFQIKAKNDIGVTVASAAGRAKYWSNRFCMSTAVSCAVTSFFWHSVQPTTLDPTSVSPILGKLMTVVSLSSIWIVTGLLSYISSPLAISHAADKKVEQNNSDVEFTETEVDKKSLSSSHSSDSSFQLDKSERNYGGCIVINDAGLCQQRVS